MTAAISIRGVTKLFGKQKALDDVSFDIPAGSVFGLLGPNGAGKTTLISQLTGQVMPNSGAIHFAGRDVTKLPSYKRSRLGLARSFQITSLLPDFTVCDNVALAAQAHDGHSFRFWGAARKEPALRNAAQAALRRVGAGMHSLPTIVSSFRSSPPRSSRCSGVSCRRAGIATCRPFHQTQKASLAATPRARC